MTTKSTFCRICEPHCPLLAEIDATGRVRQLRPDHAHPSGSIACHKGLSFLDVHDDPDRLDWPLARRNLRSEPHGRFEEAGWDEAIEEIGERLTKIRAEYGNDAVAIYIGNPFGLANGTAAAASEHFRAALGTRMMFSANTQDTANKFLGALHLYGAFGAMTMPDLANTDYLLCLGSNPGVSRWTLMSQPNDGLEVLRAIGRRGGKVRFVNPRRIESSSVETGPTLLIRPGADVYFLAAVLNEIERIGGLDEAVLAVRGKHVAELLAFARTYPPEKVAGVTGLSTAAIREVAEDIVSARSAAVYLATGVNQSRQGMLSYWLAEMIAFVTGNLGRKGGMFRPTGLLDAPAITAGGGVMTIDTSIGAFELPDPIGYAAMPAAALPALIAGGDIRALIVLGGNPVLSVGGEGHLRKAFEQLDLMVSIDIYRQATAELADYILPATDWLEHMDLNFLPSGGQPKPYVQYTEAIAAPAAGRRNGWWILARLTQVLGLPSGLDDTPDADDGHALIAGMLAMRGLTVEGLLGESGNTVMLAPEPPETWFERCLAHADGRVDCCPAAFAENGLFDRCHAIFDELSQETAGALKLISLRTRYMHNSWMANLPRFRRGANAANPLHIAPADAARHGLHDGDSVRVSNPSGSIDTRIVIDTDLRQGVVAMTHGYGHTRTFGLAGARDKPGANCNVLMPIGADQIEPISHMSWISGVPVDLIRIDS